MAFRPNMAAALMQPRRAAAAWLFGLTLAGVVAPVPTFSADALVYAGSQVSGGNGNGAVDQNECNDYSIVLRNTSDTVITGLWAVLATTTDGVLTAQPESGYPDIPPGGTATNLSPFRLSTAAWFQAGTPVDLILSVTNESLSAILPFVQTTATASLDGGGACPTSYVFNDGISVFDPLQAGRLFRPPTNEPTCAVPMPCPGLFDTEPRRHDAFEFVNRSGQGACVVVSLATRCTSAYQIFSAAYLGSFLPSALCRNYLADVRRSPTLAVPERTYSFNVPVGASFVVVVHEVEPNLGCEDYTLAVASTTGFIDYAPPLAIRLQEASVVVTWPTNAARFVLEHSPSVVPSAFVALGVAPGFEDDQFSVTNASGEPSRYYRLRKPIW